MNPIRWLVILLFLVAAAAQSQGLSADDRATDQSWARLLVEKLGHQSYQARERARRDLEALGPNKEVRDALAAGIASKSLEVRQASRSILQRFEFAEFNKQLHRLNDTDIRSDEIRMAGWKEFAGMTDEGYWSRQLFGRIARQYPSVLREIERAAGGVPSSQRFLTRADPYRLTKNDAVRWSLLLFCDSTKLDLQHPELSSRILHSLTHSGMGPTQVSPGDYQVLQQLIQHWIATHPEAGTVRSKLIVAMRYDCTALANDLTHAVFRDESASASAQATAMLCAGALGMDDLRLELRRRLFDERTAHVWQMIPSRKTKIRTQVRDVALALLLHQDGIDPRTIGFVELQADPLMLFRDHSLGFASDQQREAAHAKGRLQLGL